MKSEYFVWREKLSYRIGIYKMERESRLLYQMIIFQTYSNRNGPCVEKWINIESLFRTFNEKKEIWLDLEIYMNNIYTDN